MVELIDKDALSPVVRLSNLEPEDGHLHIVMRFLNTDKCK
jgi:hypothetical protein